MAIESIANIEPVRAIGEFVNVQTPNPGTGFVSWLDSQITEVNHQINSSQVELQKFAIGETANIHHVMLALEKAKLSFELVVQVRNRVLEAYQEVLRMQV